MRMRQRLLGLKEFVRNEVCAGREMKAPADDRDVTKVVMQEPQVYIGWAPFAENNTKWRMDALNVCPGILLMPIQGDLKEVEEKRFNQYKQIFRSQEMAQTLEVQILFSVYEPGIRLPGFMDAGEEGRVDTDRLMDGTQEGLFTLTDWMDEVKDALLRERNVPGTDMFLKHTASTYAMYSNQDSIVDKRPLYYGMLNVAFWAYADEGINRRIEDIIN